MEAIKKCLVYAYFFKHLSLSMLISFMLIKKSVVLNTKRKIKIHPTKNLCLSPTYSKNLVS